MDIRIYPTVTPQPPPPLVHIPACSTLLLFGREQAHEHTCHMMLGIQDSRSIDVDIYAHAHIIHFWCLLVSLPAGKCSTVLLDHPRVRGSLQSVGEGSRK